MGSQQSEDRVRWWKLAMSSHANGFCNQMSEACKDNNNSESEGKSKEGYHCHGKYIFTTSYQDEYKIDEMPHQRCCNTFLPSSTYTWDHLVKTPVGDNINSSISHSLCRWWFFPVPVSEQDSSKAKRGLKWVPHFPCPNPLMANHHSLAYLVGQEKPQATQAISQIFMTILACEQAFWGNRSGWALRDPTHRLCPYIESCFFQDPNWTHIKLWPAP